MTKEEAKQYSALLKAYSEGKILQYNIYNSIGIEEWVDFDGKIDFNVSPSKYRVKPDPEFVPYANASEFMNDLAVHGPFIKFDNGTLSYCFLPVGVDDISIMRITYTLGGAQLSYEELTPDRYTWQDGSPCGRYI